MIEVEQIILETTPEVWLDALMDTYGLALTKLAYSYVQDWGKAQEIVQDVFLTCYEQYDKNTLFNHTKHGFTALQLIAQRTITALLGLSALL